MSSTRYPRRLGIDPKTRSLIHEAFFRHHWTLEQIGEVTGIYFGVVSVVIERRISELKNGTVIRVPSGINARIAEDYAGSRSTHSGDRDA